jgi:hypothetical protein
LQEYMFFYKVLRYQLIASGGRESVLYFQNVTLPEAVKAASIMIIVVSCDANWVVLS